MLIFEIFTKIYQKGVKDKFYDTFNFTKLNKLIDFIMSVNIMKETNQVTILIFELLT